MPLFRRSAKKPEKGSLVQESWICDFSKARDNRFDLEETADYSVSLYKDELLSEVRRKNCFVWSDNDTYRYNDFVLEGCFGIRPPAPYLSTGFIFRKANDYNYYYFLVSNKGMFRFDQVFNNHPSTIIPWTKLISPVDSLFFIKIIARGPTFIFLVNNEWAAEIDSETIGSGTIAFAVQNYFDENPAKAALQYVSVESRPVEVEKQYASWANIYKIPDRSRLELARSLVSENQYVAAALQLKKIEAFDGEAAEALSLLSQCYLSTNMWEQAAELATGPKAEYLDKVQRDNIYCNALYLGNEFLKLRDYIAGLEPQDRQNALILNHLGNAEYALGNWRQALEAYKQSIELDPGIAQVCLNAGNCAEKINKKETFDFLNRAATLYFRNEDYALAEELLPRLRKLSPKSKEADVLEAKLDFAREDYAAAENLFDKLIKKKIKDGSVFYLRGLLSARKAEYRTALDLYEKALKAEPEFYLYQFRYAEALYYLGGDWEGPLQKALGSNCRDPWLFNFAGIAFGDSRKAELSWEYFKRALEIDPDAEEILMNYSWSLYINGRRKEALDLIGHIETASVLNHIANIYSMENEYKAAVKYYERALAMDAYNPVYMENCAGAWIELDAIARAEELLARALEIRESANLYNKIGNIARLKGEYRRAESAYQKALEISPAGDDILLNYADLALTKRELDKAFNLASKANNLNPSRRSQDLLQKIKKAGVDEITCCKCGRIWETPKDLPNQASLRVQGAPPPEAPAGSCPQCGRAYCVACGEALLKDNRFYCEQCNIPLNLSDARLRYILKQYLTVGK